MFSSISWNRTVLPRRPFTAAVRVVRTCVSGAGRSSKMRPVAASITRRAELHHHPLTPRAARRRPWRDLAKPLEGRHSPAVLAGEAMQLALIPFMLAADGLEVHRQRHLDAEFVTAANRFGELFAGAEGRIRLKTRMRFTSRIYSARPRQASVSIVRLK